MLQELSLFMETLSPANRSQHIVSFPPNAFLVYSDGFLHILKSFSSPNRTSVQFGQHVKIQPVPATPLTAEIAKLRVSDDGSRIVLQARDSLYVIHVPQEVMSLLMKKSASVDIFCECKQIVPDSLRRENKMVDFKFVSEPGDCTLAVLTSDNCIRIYNLLGDTHELINQINFTKFLQGDLNSTKTAGNSFGLYTTVVSFDQVHSVPELCLLVVDSDGVIYTVSLIDEFSPIVRRLSTPVNFPNDPVDLLAIRHSESQIFSAFVVYSNDSEGNLTHFVVFPDESGFELMLVERLTLSQAGSHPQLDHITDGNYLLGTENTIYLVDNRPWIYYTDRNRGESRVHPIASCTARGKRTGNGETVTVPCITDVGNLTLLVSNLSGGLSTSFIRTSMEHPEELNETVRLHNKSLNASLPLQIPDWKATTIDPILRKMVALPRLIGKPSEEPKVLLKKFEQWLQILVGNLVTLKQASGVANSHLSDLNREVQVSLASRPDNVEKLITLGMEVEKLKEDFEDRKRRFEVLIRRVETLGDRAKENQPLSEQEKKATKMLQEYRRTALGMCDKATELSISVADEKRATFGPAQSFQPSVTSSSATIEKSVQEVEFLRSRAEKLQDLIDFE